MLLKLLLENISSERTVKSILKKWSKHHDVLFISFSITLPEIKISSFIHPSLETLRFDNSLMLQTPYCWNPRDTCKEVQSLQYRGSQRQLFRRNKSSLAKETRVKNYIQKLEWIFISYFAACFTCAKGTFWEFD